MTPLETADVLTAIASYDLRTIGEADVIAWHAAIGELSKPLALEAVVIHHKTSTDRIKPANILGVARTILRDRESRANTAGIHGEASTHALGPAYAGLPIDVEGAPVWVAYDVKDAITRQCPRCHAAPNDACVTARGTAQRIPCLPRMTGRTTIEKANRNV